MPGGGGAHPREARAGTDGGPSKVGCNHTLRLEHHQFSLLSCLEREAVDVKVGTSRLHGSEFAVLAKCGVHLKLRRSGGAEGRAARPTSCGRQSFCVQRGRRGISYVLIEYIVAIDVTGLDSREMHCWCPLENELRRRERQREKEREREKERDRESCVCEARR